MRFLVLVSAVLLSTVVADPQIAAKVSVVGFRTYEVMCSYERRVAGVPSNDADTQLATN